jgi:hypothetical protein
MTATHPMTLQKVITNMARYVLSRGQPTSVPAMSGNVTHTLMSGKKQRTAVALLCQRR